MNKRGQILFYTLMLAIVLVILAVVLVPILTEFTGDAMAATSGDTIGLDCANSSISDFDKGTCLIIDITAPYWAAIVLGLAGMIIGARIIFGS